MKEAPNRIGQEDEVTLWIYLLLNLFITVRKTKCSILDTISHLSQDLLITDLSRIRIVREQAVDTEFSLRTPQLNKLFDNVII